MALSSSSFITWDEYTDSQETLSSSARREFGKLHENVAAVKEDIAAVKEDVAKFKHSVNKEFEKVHKDIAVLKSDVAVLKSDVAVLKEDVAVLKEDVALLKEDNSELKVKFLRAEGRTNNSSLRHPFMPLTPIPRYQPSYGMESPIEFPKDADAFYRLKTPTSKQLALLIYLAKFYDVHGYEKWEYADAESFGESIQSSSEEGQTSKQPKTLEEAIKQYPHMAVEAVAPLIGLVEENFNNYWARAAERRQQQQAQASKRAITTILETSKRQRMVQPTPPPPPKPSSSLMRRLIHPSEDGRSEPSGPSEQTRISWDHERDQVDWAEQDRAQGHQEEEGDGLYLGSPTEPLTDADDKPVSKRILPVTQGASLSEGSNVSS